VTTSWCWSDERRAREIATYRAGQVPQHQAGQATSRQAGEHVHRHLGDGEVKTLPIIVKADVQGSQEAWAQSLLKLSTDEVKVQLVLRVGGISESDVNLAIASKAVIIGFNVRADGRAQAGRKQRCRPALLQHHLRRGRRVEGRHVRHAGARAARRDHRLGRDPHRVRRDPRSARSRVVWSPRARSRRSARFRLLRDNVVVYTGELESLKRLKDDVREVKEGFECGIKLKNYNDIKEGDQLEFFEVKEVARTL
jgi:translation initiation factor IF-2